MGRELRRVPLDFNYTIGQVWKGYINPYRSMECKACDGTGLNNATRAIQEEWYNSKNAEYVELPSGRRYNKNAHSNNITEVEIKALLDAGRLMDFTRVPINEKQRADVEEKIKNGGNSWLPYNNGVVPTPEEVNEWNKTGMGHDGINRMICVEARAKYLGVYGNCEVCNGEGVIWFSDEIKEKHESFECYDPPEGEGYQLWETTSEGSPASPVFRTLEELCEWCEDNATTFGQSRASKERWLEMLSDDFVCHKEGNHIFI